MSETPNTVHGRLLEAVHISGYSFERACSELEWLLEDNRWAQVGTGFNDINDFLSTIDLSEFRIAIDQRKQLARRLQEIEASQRATAKVLGVDESTVRADLGRRNAGNPAPEPEKSPETEAPEAPIAGNPAPDTASHFDTDPHKAAKTPVVRKQKEAAQSERDATLATKAAPLPDGKYTVLYADPPWRYEHPPIGASNRSIENHYPTMTLEEICALQVEDIADDNAVLFLWATAPKLGECFEVISAWGFTYRTCMVWVKDKIGMGYHARNKHEILLIAKRGELAPPQPSDRPPSVIEAPRAEHSAKPLEFYEAIERMYPAQGKIELFSRNSREGWAAWGYEHDS